MADLTVVVLGGGTGGLVAARRLRRRLDSADRVVVVDRSPTFQFAPSFLWVMTGARRPAQISADRHRVRRAGIEILDAEAVEIDPAGRCVRTSEADVSFDRLVIALGAELAPDMLEGFTPGAHNVYTLDGVTAAADALTRFDGGRVANGRRLRSGVWRQARFLTRRDLQRLAAPHGRATTHGSLFAPGRLPRRAVITALLEAAGRLAPALCAFQVVVIDKDRPS